MKAKPTRRRQGRRWRALRRQVIADRGGRCEWRNCRADTGLEVHHLDALKDGHPEVCSPDRLRVYCGRHHRLAGWHSPGREAWSDLLDRVG